MKTELASFPAGTTYLNSSPVPNLAAKYMVAMTQGRPNPRNTLTEFDPVMFPIAESADSEFLAADILAKVSGNEVPRATSVIAVVASSI